MYGASLSVHSEVSQLRYDDASLAADVAPKADVAFITKEASDSEIHAVAARKILDPDRLIPYPNVICRQHMLFM
jgi:hypothetical protein